MGCDLLVGELAEFGKLGNQPTGEVRTYAGNRLQEIALRRLARALSLASDELIWNHVMTPYYSPFVEQASLDSAVATILEGERGGVMECQIATRGRISHHSPVL